MNCTLPDQEPGLVYPSVEFTWSARKPSGVAVTWNTLPPQFQVYFYLITLTASLCLNHHDNTSTSDVVTSDYKFGVDPKAESVSVVLTDLKTCNYSLCVAPFTKEQSLYCAGSKTFWIEKSTEQPDEEPPSWVSYFDGDSFIILMAFLFWAILISTFFKEWGAIKNLQPREISRQTTHTYPCNVSDVKVIQRERESVINYRNPDCYQSRIAKFTKMRQFRHSAPKSSAQNSPTMDSCSSGLQSKQPTIEIEFAKPEGENQFAKGEGEDNQQESV